MSKPPRRGGPEDAAAPLLTPNELAELLRVSTRSVWRMRRRGALPPPVRLQSTVRWRRRDILAWIDAGCPPTGEPDSQPEDPA